jgi:hypothetical protein
MCLGSDAVKYRPDTSMAPNEGFRANLTGFLAGGAEGFVAESVVGKMQIHHSPD